MSGGAGGPLTGVFPAGAERPRRQEVAAEPVSASVVWGGGGGGAAGVVVVVSLSRSYRLRLLRGASLPVPVAPFPSPGGFGSPGAGAVRCRSPAAQVHRRAVPGCLQRGQDPLRPLPRHRLFQAAPGEGRCTGRRAALFSRSHLPREHRAPGPHWEMGVNPPVLRGVVAGFFGSCLPQVSPYGFARSPSAVREHVPLPDLQPDAPLHGGLYCRTPVGAVPGAARLRLQQAVLPGDSLPQGQRQGTERLSFRHCCWLCSRLLGRFAGFPRSWCLPRTAAE